MNGDRRSAFGDGLSEVRRQLLEARDARAALIARLAAGERQAAASRWPQAASLLFLSLNLPGRDKNRADVAPVFSIARAGLLRSLPAARVIEEGRDVLGPWLVAACALDPLEAKRQTVILEESLPAGRLVDLDVYDEDGVQVDRRCLGLPARRCLVCDDEAVACMRTQRHSPDDLRTAIDRLLETAR